LHHFVVHGAAKQRVRMGDDGYTALRLRVIWVVTHGLQRTSGARQE
jgi:hypothetical protein